MLNGEGDSFISCYGLENLCFNTDVFFVKKCSLQ